MVAFWVACILLCMNRSRAALLAPAAAVSPELAPYGKGARKLTVVNACNATVWPVVRDSKLAVTSAYALRPGGRRSSLVRSDWAGTVGARSGCNAAGQQCETGECTAVTPCSNANVVPYTQAQFLLNSFGGLDMYTVIMDVYSLPLLVQPAAAEHGRNCQRGGCTADLREHCPAAGRVRGKAGQPLACLSACEVYKDIAHCQDASAFSNHTKRICPTGTAYVNDNDALLVCDANPDYTITFCGLL